jgi:hypothetical protein
VLACFIHISYVGCLLFQTQCIICIGTYHTVGVKAYIFWNFTTELLQDRLQHNRLGYVYIRVLSAGPPTKVIVEKKACSPFSGIMPLCNVVAP